ncbi:MAG: aspartate-semialdehyde dehydrogenase [Roseomonas sp.]|nr:aspartate-semialdehyde dehydrogenase [Roseomonas sp.]
MAHRIAVIGAPSLIGRETLRCLAETSLSGAEMVALAAGRATGAELSWGEKAVLKTRDVARFDFAGTDIAIFACDAKLAAVEVPRAAAAGAMAIDLSGHFHMEADVPLVVAGVNDQALARATKRRIIACPLPASLILAMALKPLHEAAGVRRVVAATYQPASGVGKEGMDELWSQTRGIFVNDNPEAQYFTKQIAFNVIPHIDRFMPDGATREEWALGVEIRKLLNPDIQVAASCVRVPVMLGLGMALNIAFDRPITERDARDVLRKAPGLSLLDRRDDGGYASPAEIVGEDMVYVSRIRRDATLPQGLSLWAVGDDVRLGAALNAARIAEAVARGEANSEKIP